MHTLDDLSAIRQLAANVVSAPVHLFAPRPALLAAAITMLCGQAATAAMIKTPLYLRLAEQDYASELRLKFSGKGKYKVTAQLEKGTYNFRIADEGFSCGTSFGPSVICPARPGWNHPGTFRPICTFAGAPMALS